jgi:hypothetical protein
VFLRFGRVTKSFAAQSLCGPAQGDRRNALRLQPATLVPPHDLNDANRSLTCRHSLVRGDVPYRTDVIGVDEREVGRYGRLLLTLGNRPSAALR